MYREMHRANRIALTKKFARPNLNLSSNVNLRKRVALAFGWQHSEGSLKKDTKYHDSFRFEEEKNSQFKMS